MMSFLLEIRVLITLSPGAEHGSGPAPGRSVRFHVLGRGGGSRRMLAGPGAGGRVRADGLPTTTSLYLLTPFPK